MAEIWAECGTIYYNNNQDEIIMLQELFPNIENEFMKRIQNPSLEFLTIIF